MFCIHYNEVKLLYKYYGANTVIITCIHNKRQYRINSPILPINY